MGRGRLKRRKEDREIFRMGRGRGTWIFFKDKEGEVTKRGKWGREKNKFKTGKLWGGKREKSKRKGRGREGEIRFFLSNKNREQGRNDKWREWTQMKKL